MLSIVVIIIGTLCQKVWKFLGIKSISFKLLRNTLYGSMVALSIVALLVSFAAAASLYVLYLGSHDENNNFAIAQEKFHKCEERTIDKKRGFIVLRLDDVQAYGWTETSIKIMRDAIDRDMSIVAGVIPHKIEENETVVNFLQREDCNLEVAVHGYTHGEVETSAGPAGEFAFLDGKSTKELIESGRSTLKHILKQELTTFVPPNNQISKPATQALKEEGFSVLSSEGSGLFDYDATSWDFAKDKFVYADTIIDKCEARFQLGDDLCVVMLHPQDFVNEDQSLNEVLYGEYTKLLNYITEQDISVVTFREYEKYIYSDTHFERELQLGFNGEDVRLLQRILNKNGFPVALSGPGSLGEETKFFGVKTYSALEKFQIENGISPADGQLTTLTRNALLSTIEQRF